MIRLADIHLSFSGKTILSGIDLTLAMDERTVILGESGIGKSTILRVALGLLPPDRGQVLFDGVDLFRLDETEMRRCRQAVTMVFQGGALFDGLTVGENVGYRLFEEGRLDDGEIEARVRAQLTAVGLEEAIDLFPAQLSGGMRKRVAIARALAAEPSLIFFDEPTAGLDPVAAETVTALIQRCQEHGRGTVVVTHDLACAFRVGARLLMIDDGRIVFDGDRAALERSPEPAVQRFLHPSGRL